DWYGNAFVYIGSLSHLMIPCYFDLIMCGSYEILLEHSYSLMSQFIRQLSRFVDELGQLSIQLTKETDEHTFEHVQQCPSLAAGFPHFYGGIWRNWGRDTFISLHGLFLLTGRYEEARYNARDAVWWWLYSTSNYTHIVPDGHDILSDKVSRLYPTHDSPAQSAGIHDQSLYDVIHEALLRHVQSLKFRERGAGHSLDLVMNDEGFNNEIGIDQRTGFAYGGNR
ncbi:unnamed protein product, partial [Rotaria sp. Silwood1]